MFTLHAVPGPLQKVGAAQALPLQTPEQQTPPLVVEQAVPVVRQVLPGPPSLSPPSGIPPSSLLVGFGPPQLHAANVYPITKATENTSSDFLILLLRFVQQEKTNSGRCSLELLGRQPGLFVGLESDGEGKNRGEQQTRCANHSRPSHSDSPCEKRRKQPIR